MRTPAAPRWQPGSAKRRQPRPAPTRRPRPPRPSRRRPEPRRPAIEAERAAATIDDHQTDAAALRAEQAEKLRKADELDPAVTANTADGRAVRDDRTATDGYTPAPGARERTDTTADRRTVQNDVAADRDAERTDREAAAADHDAVRADSDVIRDQNGNVRSEVSGPPTAPDRSLDGTPRSVRGVPSVRVRPGGERVAEGVANGADPRARHRR